MGSSLSAIRDDEDDYYYLCSRFNEKPHGGVYSNHHLWLEAKANDKTQLTYEEFDKQQRIKALEHEIKRTEDELSTLKGKLEKLKSKDI